MNLEIQEKVVVIRKDFLGICYQIFKSLKNEGAVPVIIDTNERVDLEMQIKSNSNQVQAHMQIDAFVNISDSEKTIHHDDILMYFYQHDELSKRLASDFSIINIGTRDALKIKGDSYQNAVIDFDNKRSVYENFFQYKVNTIVYPEIEEKRQLIDNHQTREVIEKELVSTNTYIANTVLMLLSGMSENIKNQIIFIDRGAHLFQDSGNRNY